MKIAFEAILERPEGVGTWTVLTVPLSAHERFGSKGQIKVRGTIDGEPFQSTLLPRGGRSHVLVVGKAIRDKIKATQGSRVRVVIEADAAPRKVALPKDLKAALRKRRGATAAFDKLPPSHQKEHLAWIESAKKEETGRRRIQATVDRVCTGERLKG